MKVLSLRDGRIVNPAHVQSVTAHTHFWDRSKFYVRMNLRDATTLDLAERLSQEAASALRDDYVRRVSEVHSDIDPYLLGYEEGRERGRSDGYTAGRADGYSDGHSAGSAAAEEQMTERFLTAVFEFREALVQEQRNGPDMPPSRRRYVRNAISAVTDLIEKLGSPPPAQST